MPKLTKKAIRYGRTDGPTLIIEKLRFSKYIHTKKLLFKKYVAHTKQLDTGKNGLTLIL